MLCVRHARWKNSSALIKFVQKNSYSRRSDNNTSSYKVVKRNDDAFDDVNGTVLGVDSNWELLTPNGFRFYLPGCVGPGWSDASTTFQRTSNLLNFADKSLQLGNREDSGENKSSRRAARKQQQILKCVAQECPLLLKKGIEELFPGCQEYNCPQITIVSISQATKHRLMKRNKDLEIERLAKHFIVMASDICTKLKMIGFWADFINPFSGKPHLGSHKQKALYTTDERFRCLGFKIDHKNNCKVISCDNNLKHFIGNLFTSAPMNTDFFKEIVDDYVIVNIKDEE